MPRYGKDKTAMVTITQNKPKPQQHNDAYNWRDRGCDYHPKCLECPEPKCIEELTGEEKIARSMTEFDKIIQHIAAKHRIKTDDLIGRDRGNKISIARHEAIYLIWRNLDLTLGQIGKIFDNRSVANIWNSVMKGAKYYG